MKTEQRFSIVDKEHVNNNLLELENIAEIKGKKSDIYLHSYNHLNDCMIVSVHNVLLEVVDFGEHQQSNWDFCYLNDIFYWIKKINYTSYYSHLPQSFITKILESFKAMSDNNDAGAYINKLQNLKYIDGL